MLRPVHQTTVHIESLNFRLPLGTYLGSGSEKTSTGRVWPSRGSSDSVSESAICVGGGGRGCESGGCVRGGGGVNGGLSSRGGGCRRDSTEDKDDGGDGERSGEACASQPLLSLASDAARKPARVRGWWWCLETPASSSSKRRYGSSSSSSISASRTVCRLMCSLARRCGSSRSSRSTEWGLPARDPPSEVKEKKMGWEDDGLDGGLSCCRLRNWEA